MALEIFPLHHSFDNQFIAKNDLFHPDFLLLIKIKTEHISFFNENIQGNCRAVPHHADYMRRPAILSVLLRIVHRDNQ